MVNAKQNYKKIADHSKFHKNITIKHQSSQTKTPEQKQTNQRKHHFNISEIKQSTILRTKARPNGNNRSKKVKQKTGQQKPDPTGPRYDQPCKLMPGQKNYIQNVNHLPNYMNSRASKKN